MVKKTLLSMAIAAAVVSLAGCNVSTTDKYDNKIINEGVQYGPTSSVYPIFAPEAGQVPLAIDFLFADADASDGTANTADTSPPVTTALNKLDGFSTVAPLYIEFSADLDPSTVEADKSVFLVKLNAGEKDGKPEPLLVNEANPFNTTSPIAPDSYEARYITMDDGRTPAIQILLKEPLEPKTKYLVVLTDGIKGTNGETIGQSTTYAHAIGSDEIVNPDLERVRSALQGWQGLANGFLAGVVQSKEKSVFNYTFTTGGTDDVLKAMAAPGIFLATQIPDVLSAEYTIIKSAVDGAIEQALENLATNGITDPEVIKQAKDTATTVATAGANAMLDGAANLVANAVGEPTWSRADVKADKIASSIYYKGLIDEISAQTVDLAVDKPQSRAYQAIVKGSEDPVAVPYDLLLAEQIRPKVKAVIEAQVRANPALEGADEATIQAQIDLALAANLAGEVQNQVDALSSKGSIYQGGLEIPSYLPDTEAGVADNKLGTWVASDDAAKALGLPGAPRDIDGVSTNVTYRFPFAKKLDDKTIPVMVTLPKDGTAPECVKPAGGWPVAIYQHGITVDRTAGVLVGNALAKACVAMVAIDHTMHGVAPGNATGLVFNVNTSAAGAVIGQPSQMLSPFALARDVVAGTGLDPFDILTDLKERHNNVGKDADKQNVAMEFEAAGDAADVGASGDLYINLMNFARTRDAMRQTVVDMLNLSASIVDMDIDADGYPDFDSQKVSFIGHSLGGIIGTTFVAINNDPQVQAFNGNLPVIQAAILGNPGGGVVKLLENSPMIGGGQILPGLQAAAGLTQGSADIEKFFGVMQAMVDSADPINFASSEGLQNTPVLMYTAVGDLVVPNNATNDDVVVATAKSYLAGTNPLAERLKLKTVNQGSVDATNPFVEGDRLNVRLAEAEFVNEEISAGADHSTFSNAEPQDTFKEIYTQIGSFLLGAPAPFNKGPFEGIVVSDKTVLEQVE